MENKALARLAGDGERGRIRCGIVNRQVGEEHQFCTPEYAVLCVKSGSGYYEDDDGRQYEFGPGCLVQRFPGRVHSLIWKTSGLTAYLAVPASVYQLLVDVCGSEVLGCPVVCNYGGVETFFRECDVICGLLENLPESQLMVAVNHMQQFLTVMVSGGLRTGSDLCRKVDRILGKRLPERIDIPELAGLCNMSNSSFREHFTREAGVSPGRYLIRKRLDLARSLLLQGRKSIGEIASYLKYPDIFSFSRQFKAYYGVTPSGFRRQPES